ncbi:MAG: metallophosphoesterase [Anaerolineales bacterium]
MKTLFRRTTFLIIFLAILLSATQSLPAQAQSDKIVFAVIGDYGLAGQNEADVANLVKSWNPGFIVTLGDNNYDNGAAWSIDQNIGQYYHDYIYPYTGKYGAGSPVRRFFPSLGNHDYGGDTDANAYFKYFGFYKQESFYDVIQGPVHFFIVNSNKEEPDGYTSTSTQAKWLKKTMLASTSPFNVVVFHHPPYSSGRHGSNEYMRWPFKEWGADVVLSGHDHIYERLLVNGLPYFVNGIGGAELYNFDVIVPESQVRYNQDFGAMRVEASSTTMKFQMITRTGVVVDEYVIGQNYPSVTSISAINPSSTNASTVNYQVTFSEAVTGVDASDFLLSTNINGAAIQNISGSGNTYTVSINTGLGDGTLRLDLTDNDSVTNSMGGPLGGAGLGNGNFTSGATYSIDKSAPGIISITRAGANPTNTATVDFFVTFSEAVTGIDASDFSLTTSLGASISNISGTGNTYVVTVLTGIGDDTAKLDFIDNDSVVDMAGNSTSGGFSNGDSYSIDRSVPRVTSIIRTNPGQTNTASIDFTVSFSEVVTGVDGSDFLLSTTNGATVSSVSGSGNTYAISISTKPGNDTIRLDLIDDDSISDNIGNKLGDIGIGNGNFTNSETYTVSQNVPIVTSIVRASPTPTNAASVDFIVTFSEAVDGVDISDFILTGVPNAAVLNINNMNPFFVVTTSTGTGDGELRLDLADNDSIHNVLGINLGGVGLGNANFSNGEKFLIERTAPRVTSIVRASNNPTINPSVDFIVTFSEPVTGVDASDFFVNTANLNSAVSNFQNANPFFVITVNTGAGSGALRLDLLDNGSITDLAGNKLADNGTGNGNFTNGEAFTIAKITINFPAPNILDKNSNSITNNPKPIFSWGTVRNAQAYEIFIARDANFSQIALIQTINQTNFTPATPLADGVYFVQVRAYNATLSPGKFSKPYSFIIDTTPPPPPTLVSPTNGSKSANSLLLQWKAVDGALQYQIELDNNADFSSPEFKDASSKSSIRSKALAKGATYYWHVRAKDKAGNWSSWSTSFSFSVP